jgi:amino acid adenylation domain-containing protein/non-ribosomal peptide synthase protein (TIGR01720 family)
MKTQNISEGFELSLQQDRLWNLQSGEIQPAFRTQCAVAIEGNLKPDRLQEAARRVVSRHEILRTSFVEVHGLDAPLQILNENCAPPWLDVDLVNFPLAEQQARIEQLFKEEGRLPFDLAQPVQVRFTLVTLSELYHMLLVTLPALCADAWTLKQLVREISNAYAQEDGAEEDDTQYVQFSAWQNEVLDSEDARPGIAYWQQQTAQSNPPGLTAIFDSQPVNANSFEAMSLATSIAPEVTAKIKLLAHHYDTTVEQFLLACWQILIWRLTGKPEFTIAAVSDGRKYEEVQGVCGPIAKWLPVNSRFINTLRFTEVLDQLYQSRSEASEWQEYFFWNVANMAGESFPEVGFEFEPEFPRAHAGNVTFSFYRQFSCFDRFQIKLLCGHRNDALAAEFHYDANVVQAQAIARLAAQFQTLLQSVVQRPDQLITSFDILSAGERRQVLFGFNETASVYPHDQTIHALFAQQVVRTPHAIAAEFADGSLTYSELNARANQLAHFLLALGLAPESPVGLCLERSCDLVVATLAVLKAGGAYLPLDPTYPIERLSFMLDDAGVNFLIAHDHLLDQLPADSRHVFSMDSDWMMVESLSTENTPVTIAESPAYIIYTSGSTGIPKGISIPHRGVVRLVCETNYIHLEPGLRIAQASNISFDAATFELWGALLHGGTLVGLNKDSILSPETLYAELRRLRIDVLFLTTALFNQVARENPETFSELRELLFGGEAVDVKWVRRVLEAAGPRRLLHVYGPTESTTFATWHEVREIPPQALTIPIGQALGNTTTYVLDEQWRAVPVGVAGELYLGGDGLARDYLGRAALTAERFVPDPFSGREGARLYRTGDVVRYDAQGQLEFIGRADDQVKIRGFRIELGEVEAVLSAHSEVAEVAVVARNEENGERRLTAYVVGAQASEPAALQAELRRYMRERVPEYMVPATFVMLAEMPLTLNGKIDRRALPEPAAVECESEHSIAPRTPVEELVAESWAEFLGLTYVGVQDNFFDLGGHSLLATQVISRVREIFGVELPLRTLFDNPTVESLSEAIEEAQREGAGIGAPPIVPVDRGTELPLSFAQQRLWFLDQLEPGNAFYNVPSSVRLTGKLNVEVLERTLTEIVRRHEALRTAFVTVDGIPRQVIGTPYPVTLAVTDLSGWTETEREAEARRLANAEGQQSFDLAQGPLLRARLLKLGDEEHIVLLTMHHIVSDGWSMGLLIDELSKLYVAYVSGAESPLPELPIQYGDFAHWQQHWLQGEVLEQQMAYWREQLANAPAVLELPTDRPRPAVQSFRGMTHSIGFSAELTEGLKRLSRTEGVTLFMTLLAAYQTLLSRYTGQRGISVGTPIANRNRRETEPLIGFFVNTLVLHTEVRGAESFRQLLGRVREQTLGAYAHQDVPFEKLVEELQPERNLSTTPLFQVMFVYQNAGENAGALDLPGLQLRGIETESQTAKFELTLAMSEGHGELGASFEYNTDLFNTQTIERLASHFERLLESIVADPEQSVAGLKWLSEAEQQQLLIQWNDTHADYPTGETVHRLFEQQVARTPEQIALSCGDSSLTYAELNQRSNQLAHYLRELGVGPEVRVGVLMQRSVEMVVSLLGILKAGGAYVALDPQYPQSRISFMLQDARAHLLLTETSLRELVTVSGGTRLICLDEEKAISSYSSANPEVSLSSSNLAYVIYTSGSTGIPKGVAIQHHSTATLIHWAQATFAPTAWRGVLASTSLCFDLSVFELFVPLSCGGRVMLIDNALAFPVLEARDSVTLINTVPSAMAELVRQHALPESVEVVNLAGEALPRNLVEAIYDELPGCSVYNLYGPSEDTTYSTGAMIERGEQKAPAIGLPVANTQAYVLDEWMQLVAPGISGELYLSGEKLARGYMERAELTAEKFIPNPYGNEAGARMYRTGDRARWTTAGELEYLGRMDQQVKIRGYRIELGEIESRLAQHDDVREAVVVVNEEDGHKRLLAYVVPAGETVPGVGELRSHLGEKLPEYMIPSTFVTLDQIPLTANGKVNRRALPRPDNTRPDLAHAFVAPRNEVERTLASIWAQLLNLSEVGIHDNFFELGGDSIISIQIVARAQQAGLRLTPKQLFQNQTIAQLATIVGTAKVVVAEQGLVTGEVPLTPVQQWFFEQDLSEAWHYNQSLLLEVREGTDAELLERAVRKVIEHHDALRMRFVRGPEGEWRQANAADEMGPIWRKRDLSSIAESEQAAAIEAEAQQTQESLDLERGPVAQFVHVNLGAGKRGRLLIVAHHLVMDGVSWRVLLEDVVFAYEQLVAAKEVKLAPKTTSYKRWAEQLLEYGSSDEVSREAGYWFGELERPVSGLPVDYEVAALNTVATMKQVQVALSVEDTQALLTHVPSAYQTRINEVLLAALVIAYERWSGAPRLLVEVEGHGREEELFEADLSRTVGWFTSIYPVMLEVKGSEPGEHLKSVKEHLRSMPQGGLNFGVLRYLGRPEIRERLARMAVAEVSFNYLGQFDQVLDRDGLLRPARESSGQGHSPTGKRPYLLEISGGISDGRLQLGWMYSSALHKRESIEAFAAAYTDALRTIITHCQSEQAGGFTPSDFPEAALSQEELDQLVAELSD